MKNQEHIELVKKEVKELHHMFVCAIKDINPQTASVSAFLCLALAEFIKKTEQDEEEALQFTFKQVRGCLERLHD